MTYFSYIPNTTYEVNGKTSIVKDICKRSNFISEYKPYTDLYSEYTVSDSDTLESLAYEYYGSATYHWVIAMFNELHNLEFEFPMNQLEIENYCKEKYGEDLYKIKHYVDSNNVIVGYTQEYYPNYVNTIAPTQIDEEAYFPVTFYDHENNLNEEKRKLKLLRPELLAEFITQFGRSFNG